MSRARAERAKALEEWAERVDASGLRHTEEDEDLNAAIQADIVPTEPTPFEFIIEGPAVSHHAGNKARRREWKGKVEEAARKGWNAGPLPIGSPVAVTITYFSEIAYSSERKPGEVHDVDNLAKPIMDAMKEIVYEDDAQVSDLRCRVRGYKTRIENPPARLTEFLKESKPVVHVRVDPAPDLTVAF